MFIFISWQHLIVYFQASWFSWLSSVSSWPITNESIGSPAEVWTFQTRQIITTTFQIITTTFQIITTTFQITRTTYDEEDGNLLLLYLYDNLKLSIFLYLPNTYNDNIVQAILKAIFKYIQTQLEFCNFFLIKIQNNLSNKLFQLTWNVWKCSKMLNAIFLEKFKIFKYDFLQLCLCHELSSNKTEIYFEMLKT